MAALARSEPIRELVDPPVASSLSALLESLPRVGCPDLRSLATRFVVQDINERTTLVAVAPENRGGRCRGSLTVIVVEIPIPPRALAWFDTARRQRTFAEALGAGRGLEW